MATSPSSGTRLVLDASAFIRALVDGEPQARRWVEHAAVVVPAWPTHLYAEVANTLVTLVRSAAIDRGRAAEIFEQVRRWHARAYGRGQLHAAMGVALERRLSVYDAAYVVLAEALEAPLVTADRRLAEATAQAILI